MFQCVSDFETKFLSKHKVFSCSCFMTSFKYFGQNLSMKYQIHWKSVEVKWKKSPTHLPTHPGISKYASTKTIKRPFS